MTPTERLLYARSAHARAVSALLDAQDECEDAVMEMHLARFIDAAASQVCPSCGEVSGAYCSLVEWRGVVMPTGALPEDSYRRPAGEWPRLLRVSLCPARTLAVALELSA